MSTDERNQDPGSSSRSEERNGKRVTFSSTCTTVVTLLGFSLGTSDFWRFPFLVYRNGGGAFLIPFTITILLCGIPLYFLEYSLSKFSGKGPYAIWDISPLFRGTAYSVIIGYSVYNTYISVFRSWMTEFLVNSFQSPLPWSHCNNTWNTQSCREYIVIKGHSDLPKSHDVTTFRNISDMFINSSSNMLGLLNTSVAVSPGKGMSASEEFWQFGVLELSSGVTDFGSFQWKYALYHVVTRVMVVACVYKSIKSIEKVMFVSMFGPILIITAMLIRSLTLPGALDGIQLFFHTDFTKLEQPRVWVEAAVMAFYTLVFGWGANLTLGSHADFRDNPARTATIVPILDAAMAVFNGMVCFSVLGTMAHAVGSPVSEVVKAGMSVGMVAYPSAIAELPAPQLWSVLFFIALMLQGLDNQMVVVEMTLQVIGDAYPALMSKRRTMILILINLLYFLAALPLCTRAGGYLFLFLDWYTGAWVGPIIAFLELIVVLWVYGGDRFSTDISLMTGSPIPALNRITLAFITPVIVAILQIVSMLEYAPPQYGDYKYPSWVEGLGWTLLSAVFLPSVIYMVYYVRRGNKSILKNLKTSLRPLSSWGPVEDSGVEYYNNCTPKRSFKDLLMFNLLGRYTHHREDMRAREITLLPSQC